MPCGTKPVVQRGGRVHRPGAAVGAHRHAAHRLDAAGEDQVLEAAADPRGGLVDGLEAGGAEAVELHAGDGLGVAGLRAPRSWRCRRPGRRSGRRRRARRRRSRCGSSEGLRVLSSSSSPTTRSTGLTSCSEPTFLPLPRGVRMWSYTNASAMTVLIGDGISPSIVTAWAVTITGGPVWSGSERTRRKGGHGRDVGALRELLTLDELTKRVGMSVRNVRFYATQGLVPPPIRRGRSGYYTPDHVARLELVQELQGHGFTLSAIERYVAQHPRDATPEDIALQRTMLAPWQHESPIGMSRGELAQPRRPHATPRRTCHADSARRRLSPCRRGRLPGRGLPALLALGLLDLGFPTEPALAAAEVYAAHGRAIAEELYERLPHQGVAGLPGVRAPPPSASARSWSGSSRSRWPAWSRPTRAPWTTPSARASLGAAR